MSSRTARWQSSQRPLFVRTVWVDGRRHAVLTRDDPALRYHRPSSSGTSDTSSESASDTCCHLADCLVKLRIALHPDSYQGTYQESIFPIQAGSVDASRCYHEDNDSLCGGGRLPLLGQYPRVYSLDPAPVSLLPDTPEQLNPLSERVLQWLDLSGRTTKINTTSHQTQEPRAVTERRRVTHESRSREQSSGLEVLAKIKLSARGLEPHQQHNIDRRHRPLSTLKSPEVERVLSPAAKDPEDPPPVVQTFQPPRLMRPTSWSHTTAARPQLHIFIPLVDTSQGDKGDERTND